jgi:glycosyltransferase involved in cell wall biosynthesis
MKIFYSALTEYYWMHISEVVNNLAELGHEVHVAGFLRSRPANLHPSVNFYNITFRNRDWFDFCNYNFWRNFYRWGKKRLSTNNKYSFYESWIEDIMNSIPFDLVYERRNDLNPAIFIAWNRGIPSILELNGIQPIEFEWKGYNPEKIKYILDNELAAIRCATKVICVSSGIRNYFVDKGFDPDKFVVIPNGANNKLFYPMDKKYCRNRLGLSLNRKIIGVIGSMQPFYEIDCVIKALPRILNNFPDVYFIVVGREYPPPLGHSKKTLQSLANEMGVSPRVEFIDPVPYEEVPLYINSFDICLLPIVKRQGWYAGISPLKLKEYLACGQPVIVSNVRGESQLLKQIGAGIHYEAGNPNDLADKVCTILKDEHLARRIGENGLRYVSEQATWKHVVKRILTIAEGITGKNNNESSIDQSNYKT